MAKPTTWNVLSQYRNTTFHEAERSRVQRWADTEHMDNFDVDVMVSQVRLSESSTEEVAAKLGMRPLEVFEYLFRCGRSLGDC